LLPLPNRLHPHAVTFASIRAHAREYQNAPTTRWKTRTNPDFQKDECKTGEKSVTLVQGNASRQRKVLSLGILYVLCCVGVILSQTLFFHHFPFFRVPYQLDTK
jgi:hypothetical protein